MNFKILSKKSEKILKQCIKFNTKIEKIKLCKIIPINLYEKFIVDKYSYKTDEEKLKDANLTTDEYYSKKLWSKVFNKTPFPFDEEGNEVNKNEKEIHQENYYWLFHFLHLDNEYYEKVSKEILRLNKSLENKISNNDERDKILDEKRMQLMKHNCINSFKKLTIFGAFKKWWEGFGSYLNIDFDWFGEDKEGKNSVLSLLTSSLCDKWQDFFKKAKLSKVNFGVSTNMFYMSEIKFRMKKENINFQDLEVKIWVCLYPHIFNELKDANYIDNKKSNDRRLIGYQYDKRIYVVNSKITDKDGPIDSGFYFLNVMNTYFKNKRIAFILPWLTITLSVLAIFVSIIAIVLKR